MDYNIDHPAWNTGIYQDADLVYDLPSAAPKRGSKGYLGVYFLWVVSFLFSQLGQNSPTV